MDKAGIKAWLLGEGRASAVKAIQTDHKQGGDKYRLLMPQSEKPANRLANLRTFRAVRLTPAALWHVVSDLGVIHRGGRGPGET